MCVCVLYVHERFLYVFFLNLFLEISELLLSDTIFGISGRHIVHLLPPVLLDMC